MAEMEKISMFLQAKKGKLTNPWEWNQASLFHPHFFPFVFSF